MNHPSIILQLKNTNELSSSKIAVKYFQKNNDLSKDKQNAHFKYHKLYSPSKTSRNSPKVSEKMKIKLKYKKKYEDLKKVFQIPQKSKPNESSAFLWPKLTKAKLPFTFKKKISPEEKKKKIRSLKPTRKFHNFYTVKWLRSKYSDSLLEKSINTLLPDNGKPVIPDDETEEEKNHRILMEFLDSLKPVNEKEKNVNINPKYFFDKETFEKILKLKKIFLEFDEDGSRKMELDEMLTMFNQNHINADIKELVNLFFKNQKFKEKDVMNLYLDFYQFMEFAINKEQAFRDFMREIKEKYKRNKNWKDDHNTYLPMNFNLVLDYFILKGKERSAIEVIENSINAMDKVLNNDKKHKNSNPNSNLLSPINRKDTIDTKFSNFLNKLSSTDFKAMPISLSGIDIAKTYTFKEKNINSNNSKDMSSEESDKIDTEQLEKINFKEPMKEFEKLINTHGIRIEKSNDVKPKKNYEKKISKMFTRYNSVVSDKSTNFGKTASINKIMSTKNILESINDSSANGKNANGDDSKEQNKTIIYDIFNKLLNRRIILKKNSNSYDRFNNPKCNTQTNNNQIKLIKKLNIPENIKDSNDIKTNNNSPKENKEFYNNSFLNKKKLKSNNSKNSVNSYSGIKLYPLSSSRGDTKSMTKFPSNEDFNKFMVSDYLKKNSNIFSVNETFSNFSKSKSNKKYNKFTSLEKSIKKKNYYKYDYVPKELFLDSFN